MAVAICSVVSLLYSGSGYLQCNVSVVQWQWLTVVSCLCCTVAVAIRGVLHTSALKTVKILEKHSFHGASQRTVRQIFGCRS